MPSTTVSFGYDRSYPFDLAALALLAERTGARPP
jgi:hypothetical protein